MSTSFNGISPGSPEAALAGPGNEDVSGASALAAPLNEDASSNINSTPPLVAPSNEDASSDVSITPTSSTTTTGNNSSNRKNSTRSSSKEKKSTRKASSSVSPEPLPEVIPLVKLHGEEAYAVADIDINIDGDGARAYLQQYHFPQGLIELIVSQCIRSGPRYYVIDDSGSMATRDGERILDSETKPGHANHIKCTRWEELKDSLKFQAGLLHAANMPCIFRFLNGPRVRFPKDGAEGLKKLLSSFDDEPSGNTLSHPSASPTPNESAPNTTRTQIYQYYRFDSDVPPSHRGD